MEKYVIIGEYKDNKKIIFISNTYPICWVNEDNLSKKYDRFYDAVHDILYEYNTYKTTILGTDINYISILNTNTREITPIINEKGEVLVEDD